MARTTRVVLTCDLRHSTEVEATGTAVITLNGDRYEIDVCDKHGADIVARARKSRRPSGRTPATTRTAAKKSSARRRASNKDPATKRARRSATDGAAIRAWAASNGYAVSPRGRIASTVLDAYAAENKK